MSLKHYSTHVERILQFYQIGNELERGWIGGYQETQWTTVDHEEKDPEEELEKKKKHERIENLTMMVGRLVIFGVLMF